MQVRDLGARRGLEVTVDLGQLGVALPADLGQHGLRDQSARGTTGQELSAHAQVGGEIPGGQWLLQLGDAIFNFIRRYIGPIVVGLVFLATLIGATAGSVQQGVGKAVITLLIGSFIAAGTLWWPWAS